MISCFWIAPGKFSLSSPLSKTKICGTLRILYFEERFGFWSTFILPTLILLSESFAKSSITGMKALQLEHQGAQAQRSTGKGEFNTFSSKLASVITIG